jgi:hypothetical protein
MSASLHIELSWYWGLEPNRMHLILCSARFVVSCLFHEQNNDVPLLLCIYLLLFLVFPIVVKVSSRYSYSP